MEGRSYKNKGKAQDIRALRNHRRSLDQKASRLDQANKRRNLNLLEPLEEHESQVQNSAAKKGKDPMERLEQLKKWKEQKMLKRKIEERTKKPVFKVSTVKPQVAVKKSKVPSFTKGAAPSTKAHPQTVAKPPARTTKTTTTKKSEVPPSTSSRRITRASVASIDPKPAARSAVSRHSTGNQRSAVSKAPVKPATKTTTASRPPAARSTRTSSATSSAAVPLKTENSSKTLIRRSTRTSVRSESTETSDIKVNARHVTKRSEVQEEEEDDLVFQYAPNNFVFEFQAMDSASLLFPENADRFASPKMRRSIRLSSKDFQRPLIAENEMAEAEGEPQASSHDDKTNAKDGDSSAESSDDVFSEDTKEEKISDNNMENVEVNAENVEGNTKNTITHDNTVNNKENMESVNQENVEQPEEQAMETGEAETANDVLSEDYEHTNTRAFKAVATPKSVPRNPRRSCAAITTPIQNAPLSAMKQRRSMSVPIRSTPNDRRVGFKMPATTPSELILSSKRLKRKDFRRSTALRGLSPEECVIVLSHSPMIEMERRPYKASKSPVAQLDFNEDEIEAMIQSKEKAVNETKTDESETIPEPTMCVEKMAEEIKPSSENTDSSSENTETLPAAQSENTESAPSEKSLPKPEIAETSTPASQEHNVPYFRNLLVSESERLNIQCEKWNAINVPSANINDEIRGQIRTTVGQAQLLMSQRFKQFSGLVDNCEFNTGEKETTFTDLDGFWEMVFIQVEDVDMKFTQLDKLRNNDWKEDKPVVKKKLIKKNPVLAGATKGTKKPAAAKPSGPSKFAAFRAKMQQQKKEEEEQKEAEKKRQEEQKEEEKEEQKMTTTIEDAEMKTFDAGFFQVCSPLSSPKLHCEGGSPNTSSNRSSLKGGATRLSGSPMLKSVLDKSARRMSRSNPNSPISGANISMRLSRSNPGSPMHITKTTVDLSSAVTSLRQEVLTKQLASASKMNSSFGPSIFSPDNQTPQSLTSIRRSSRRRTLNQSVEATSSPTGRRSVGRSLRNTPAAPGADESSGNVDFMSYLMPSASPAMRDRPSESLSSMEAEDGPQASPQVHNIENIPGSPQVLDVDMAPPSKVSLTQEFLNMPSSAGKCKKSRLSSGGRNLSQSERRKSRKSAVAKRHSVRFTSSTTSEDSSPLARMPLTPFNRDYAGSRVTSPPVEGEEVFLFTPPTENMTPRGGKSTTPATRMSKLSFKSPAVKDSPAHSIFTPRRTRRSVAAVSDLITFT